MAWRRGREGVSWRWSALRRAVPSTIHSSGSSHRHARLVMFVSSKWFEGASLRMPLQVGGPTPPSNRCAELKGLRPESGNAGNSFIHAFLNSFIHPFVHSFIHSCIHSFNQSTHQSINHSMNQSFNLSFVQSFIHSLIHWAGGREEPAGGGARAAHPDQPHEHACARAPRPAWSLPLPPPWPASLCACRSHV